MSDSEDDYMSDKLLMECQTEEDVCPGLLVGNREKRKFEAYKQKEDFRFKRPKPMRLVERDVRDQGLETAISSENKGFKLLEKMGFKAGEALGKSNTGLKEPLNIVVHQGTSGIGRKTHEQEMRNKKREYKLRKIRERESRFRVTNREKSRQITITKDFLKAQRLCEELDFRIHLPEPVEEFFWTWSTIKRIRREQKKDVDFEDDDEDSDEEFYDLWITEENLFSIINYLRTKHLYCMYCVITGINDEDLRENCPGPYRIDHDSEYGFE